ncbi:MAG: amidohydrolase [Solobacterium sp.]|nr:amidohydrolase [Solobacterium sp.]
MDQKRLCSLSDAIWGYAETGFTEEKSARAMAGFLRDSGFEVTEGIDGMPTAYMGVYGHGRPVIDVLAEYDALSGMSQQADVPERRPVTSAEDNGHGCGHELLGAGAVGAAILLKEYLEKTGREGTVRLVGCPAEESGSSKAYLARDGFFKDTDCALTWHPADFNMVCSGSSQSCISLFFRYTGVSAHAAGSPQLGRSALDAAELTNVGVNYLREHIEDTDRVHYAYLNVGGKAPNVVQSEAILKYFVRSKNNPDCERLLKRVILCAQGAAMMTETKVEVIFDEGLSNTVPNFTLEKAALEAFRKCGTPSYTEEELAYAKTFRDTFDMQDAMRSIPRCDDPARLRQNMKDSPINDYLIEVKSYEDTEMGSTDVGDVSWVVPTVQINTACFAYGAGAHSWQWVAQGTSAIAHKGMLKAAEVLAELGIRLFEDPQIIEEAKAELQDRLGGETYKCLIPEDIRPHISTLE